MSNEEVFDEGQEEVGIDGGVGASNEDEENNEVITTYPVRTDVISSVNNTTTTPLGIGGVFTGDPDRNDYSDGLLNFKASHNCTVEIQQSLDAVNWDAVLTYRIPATVNETHRFVKGNRYVRVVITNTSGAVMTYLRCSLDYGNFTVLTRPANTTVYQDTDAQVVRTIDTEIDIGAGRFDGFSVVAKSGRNPDIDTGTVPEDVWDGGGLYTGFPTGAPEEIQVFSDNAADTGSLTFTYLASNTATAWQTATVTLNGTTPVNTGVTAYRVHMAKYNTGAGTTFNAGNITIRHRTTTTNVFAVMPAGRSQTYVAAYTIPVGYIGIITRAFAYVFNNSASSTIDGGLFIRELGASPRIRRNFTAGVGFNFEERVYGGLRFNAMTDIIPRIFTCSANNTEVLAGYDLLLVKI